MIRLRLLVPTLLLLAPCALAGDLVVLHGRLAPDLARRVQPHLDYYGSFGDVALAEGDAKGARAVSALDIGVHAEAVAAWQDAWTVFAAPHALVPRASVSVLYAGRTLTVFATTEPRVAQAPPLQPWRVRRVPFTPGAGFRRPAQGGIPVALQLDPRIAALAAQVNPSNLQATVQHLSTAWTTRRGDSAQIQQVKDWLVAQLQAIPGISVTTQTFQFGHGPNIVITKQGVVHPERLVLGGAHYDSINLGGSSLPAPGADDNGSGTAAVLEAARVLAQGSFENTVRLVLFGSEELGLLGSGFDADQLADASAQVLAVLNVDMIGHVAPGDAKDLDFITNDADAALIQFCRDAAAVYVPGLPTVTGSLAAGTSDHLSYTAEGFPACFLFEDATAYSPVLHTAQDLVGVSVNDFTFMADATRAFIASLAALADPVDLQITHSPLADTADAGGPYPFSAAVSSLIGTTPAAVRVHWSVNGGAEQVKDCVAAAQPGTWLGAIPGGVPSGLVRYYLVAVDDAGNLEWAPDGGSAGDNAWTFTIGTQQTLFFDDFEGGDNGWVHAQIQKQDDWQKGTPQPSFYDPPSAASGTQARGNDLGIGNFDGNYQSDVINYLESPPVDCTAHAGVRLRYQRWLTVEDGYYDQAQIRVNGQIVWQNPGTPGGGAQHTIDAAWTGHDLDVSSQADHQPTVRVRFQLQSDGGLQLGGWTVDDVELYTLKPGTTAPLVASDRYLSAAQGGSIAFSIDAPASAAGRTCLLAMGASGSAPATLVNGVAIPLVFDPITQVGFGFLNTPPFLGFAQPLSAAGDAQALLTLPPIPLPGLAGLTLTFAAFTVAPVTWASNPVEVTFGL